MSKYKCKCGKTFDRGSSLASHQNWCEKSESKRPNISYEKIKCKKCGQLVAEPQIERHVDSKKCKRNRGELENHNNIEDWKIKEGVYECPICEERFGKYGIGAHYYRKHVIDPSDYRDYGDPWNKGLTEEDDERVKKYSETLRKKYENNELEHWCEGLTKENSDKVSDIADKISKTVNKKIENNNWHYSFSKVRTYNYKGVNLHGSWELKFAKYLDKNGICWERPDEKFVYQFEGEERHYIPDFYIPERNKYIEIKGYKTEKDEAKWEYFPCDLEILREEDLEELNII